ncbi:MAG: Rieske (2Fe-2S) protein [Alphaproteobacteria bacterium]
MGDAVLLEAKSYTDPITFQAERKAIFGTGWQVVAPAASLDGEGSYAALGLGGWPLFAIRGDDGAVRCFRNVCSHQKMPVLDNGRGRCAQVRCRFHGWTYDTRGRLVSAPQPVAPDDGDLARYPLEVLQQAEAGGLVFVRLDARSGDAPAAGDIPLDGLAHCGAETRALNPNWKAVLDVLVDGPASPAPGAGGRYAWLWPTTGLWAEPDGTVVMQVVPRTFRKTELHLHGLGADADAVMARASAWADRVAAAAEARQQAAEAGAPADAATAQRLAPLHDWIRTRLQEMAA